MSMREVAHDLADRDAEALALDDGAHERLQVRRVDPLAQVLQRFRERRAHALLLEREAHLLAQRALEPVVARLQRRREADARLEAHDELIDEVRGLALDLERALLRAGGGCT